ncbi:helix-turn-helix domain-containing protein [Prolixibacteraceae bacterium Z1-6]|uniref:Helix-turn-helix domain-containing protein n=1 Tax=Draconibacterium aestuarii TaxID=2998507 RepID=A0A9X3J480_9BACT|nr:helix-turn-helix domain-containing protein [Prolixibacteraceae bacterium Z1-6]
MSGSKKQDELFLDRLTEIVEANLTNEQFGVSELASKYGKSRSYIHRRLKAIADESVSQFIRRLRLEKARTQLEQDQYTVSEIAYNVGFSSPTYFSRCFHNHFGYPPGEVKKRTPTNIANSPYVLQTKAQVKIESRKISRIRYLLWSVVSILVIAVCIIGYWFYKNESLLGAKSKELSIIVLPFKNLSGNPSLDYFSEGIREDILNNLYWITGLRVVSRTSAEQFRESTLSAHEIAKRMNVNYVLEGSIRRGSEKVRITVQLIDLTKHEDHLWSANFDREVDNIIGVQDEIALQVASKIKTVLSEHERQKIEKISTNNSKAYEYFLQARFLHHKTTSDLRNGFDKTGVENCLKYYEMAIAADENFVEAYAGLAKANFNLSAWGFLGTTQGFIKAQELANKALELDPECAEAHTVLGGFFVWAVRNLDAGGKELEKGVHLNPNFATARQWYAQYLMITGPIEEARNQVNYALALEPNFWVVQNLNSWIYYFEEKYKESLEACSLARDFNPNFSSNQWLFVINYAKLGEGEKMKEQLKSIAQRYSGTDGYSAGIEQAYQKAGIDGLFMWLIDVNKNNPILVEGMNGHPFFIAWWNAILGNDVEALYWLEETVAAKRKPYHYFNLICTNPDFEELHNNPRFVKVVDQIGLSPYLKQEEI